MGACDVARAADALEALVAALLAAPPCAAQDQDQDRERESRDGGGMGALAFPPGVFMAYPAYPVFPPPPAEGEKDEEGGEGEESGEGGEKRGRGRGRGRQVSRNVRWVEEVLRGGLPRCLVRRLVSLRGEDAEAEGEHGADGEDGARGGDGEERLRMALGRLVACVGFRAAAGDAEGMAVRDADGAAGGSRAGSGGSAGAGSNDDAGSGGAGSSRGDSDGGMKDRQERRREDSTEQALLDHVSQPSDFITGGDDNDDEGDGDGAIDDDIDFAYVDEADEFGFGAREGGARGTSTSTSTSMGTSMGKSTSRSKADVAEWSAAAQARRARRAARLTVYDMRFLCRARQWGPYVPAAALGGLPADREGERRAFVREVMEVMFGADGADEYEYEYEEGDEEDDDDDDEEEESASSGVVVYTGDEGDEEEEEEASEGEADKSALYGDSFAHESYTDDTDDNDSTHPPSSPGDKWNIGSWAGTAMLPLVAGLRPDWAFLCAVRVVVEANMREAVGARELGGLLALDALRAGSAPLDVRTDGDAAWFAGAAKPGAGFADGTWDWAGVTGVWRSVFVCVCSGSQHGR